MKPKKIIMIILLIGFIIGIGICIVNINNKSEEKISEIKQEPSNNLNNVDMSNIVEITDDLFIQQTNDIYYNLEDYLGKTIKIEGFISNYQENNKRTCYCVLRNTPGCCGNDGLAGLDIRCDGEYPELDTWVEVVGVIGKDVTFDNEIPAIYVSSIKEKEKGQNFVTN